MGCICCSLEILPCDLTGLACTWDNAGLIIPPGCCKLSLVAPLRGVDDFVIRRDHNLQSHALPRDHLVSDHTLRNSVEGILTYSAIFTRKQHMHSAMSVSTLDSPKIAFL